MPTVQVSFFVGISIIYLFMAFDETTLLMSIMAMASHDRQVFHFFRVVCVGKGFEDEFSDNSDLLFLVRQESVLARDNPMYGHLLE
jgi:hypothetical protein